jgi:hypothetical protein
LPTTNMSIKQSVRLHSAPPKYACQRPAAPYPPPTLIPFSPPSLQPEEGHGVRGGVKRRRGEEGHGVRGGARRRGGEEGHGVRGGVKRRGGEEGHGVRGGVKRRGGEEGHTIPPTPTRPASPPTPTARSPKTPSNINVTCLLYVASKGRQALRISIDAQFTSSTPQIKAGCWCSEKE